MRSLPQLRASSKQKQKQNSQVAALLLSFLVHNMSGEYSGIFSLQEALTMQLDEVQCAVRAASIIFAVQQDVSSYTAELI